MGMFDVIINTPVKYTRVCEKGEDGFFKKSDPELWQLFDKGDLALRDVLRILKGSDKRNIHRLRPNDWAKIMDANPNHVVVAKSTEERTKRLMAGAVSPMQLTDRPILMTVDFIDDIDTELFKIYGYFSLK